MKTTVPEQIERDSMSIIREELRQADMKLPEDERSSVILRCIHTSADFDYFNNLHFTSNVVQRAVEAVSKGAHIVTDTRMAWSGINRRAVSLMGGDVHCFMDHEDVAVEAKHRNCTRSVICMERGMALAERIDQPVIFAVGNAPTALIRLADAMEAKQFNPFAVIAVPVGFVNVVEAKEMIMSADCPSITARGRKGGSNIAAAICNAIIYQAMPR